MAIGDNYLVLYKPFFSLDGMDVSKAVTQVGLSIEYATVDPRHVIGGEAPIAGFSAKYSWNMSVTFLTDAFGASTLMAVIEAILPVPVSASTTADGQTTCVLRPARENVSAANPQWTGPAIMPMWNPIGGGAINSFVENQVTLMGAGTLTRAVS